MNFREHLKSGSEKLFWPLWSIPHSIHLIIKLRRARIDLMLIEAERIDRIRHPSKYLGK